MSIDPDEATGKTALQAEASPAKDPAVEATGEKVLRAEATGEKALQAEASPAKAPAVGGDDATDEPTGYPDPDKDKSRQNRTAVSAGAFFGSAGNHNTTNINVGGEEPFEKQFLHVPVLPEFKTYEPHVEVEKAAEGIIQHRILVLERTSLGREEAISALYSLLDRLQGQLGQLKRYTDLHPLIFPLRGILNEQSWIDALRNSIVYLVYSDAPETMAQLYRREFATALSGRLTEANCYLVLVTHKSSSLGTSLLTSVHAPAHLPVWHVRAASSESAGSPIDGQEGAFEDPVESVIKFCAVAFPGLGVAEFMALNNRLLPQQALPVTPNGTPTSGSSGTSQDGGSRPASSLARWWLGERDAIIREKGVRFWQVYGQSSAAGYYLQDFESSEFVLGGFFRNAPVFLVQHLEALTVMFLQEEWSQRFRVGYLRYLLSLHTSQIQRLTVDWLVAKYQDCAATADADARLERYVEMLKYIVGYPECDRLVAGVLDLLARQGIRAEERWLSNLLAHHEKGEFEPDKRPDDTEDAEWAWRTLDRLQLREQFLHVISEHRQIYKIILALLEHSEEAALRATEAHLTGPPVRSQFRDMVRDQPGVEPFLAPSCWIFVSELGAFVRDAPAGFAQYAEALLHYLPAPAKAADVKPGAVVGHLFGNESARRLAARATLADACLLAFRSLVQTASSRGDTSNSLNALITDGTAIRTGELLATLLTQSKGFSKSMRSQQGDSMDVDGITYMYEKLCRALLAREGSDETSAFAIAVAFIRPLRNVLNYREHRAIQERTKELEQIYRARRDFFSKKRAGRRESYERGRVRAVHILMRALRS